MSESTDAREWHRIIRASVRECLEPWALQAQAGSVTVEALETILARAMVPILRAGRRASARASGRCRYGPTVEERGKALTTERETWPE